MRGVVTRARSRVRLCSLLTLAAVSSSTPANARSTLSVALELAPCVEDDAAGLRRVVQAELGSSINVLSATAEPSASANPNPNPNPSPSAAPSDPQVARVTVDCSGALIDLEVLDPVTGKKLSRHLQIPSELAGARTRVLGVSIAELVAASWIELSGTSASPARVVEATASPDTRSAALSAAKRSLDTGARGYEVLSFALAQRLPRAHFDSFGVGVGFDWIARDWLDLSANANGEAGTHAVSLGHIDALLGSVAFCPRVRRAIGNWSFEAGPGMRVGLAHLSGVARADLSPVPEQRSPTLPWAGPMLELGVSVRPLRPLLVSGVLEAGFVSYSAEARVAGQGEFSIAGPWLGLGLGFGFSGVD
jgi:hypothetical protein